jgi:hypothetical protein
MRRLQKDVGSSGLLLLFDLLASFSFSFFPPFIYHMLVWNLLLNSEDFSPCGDPFFGIVRNTIKKLDNAVQEAVNKPLNVSKDRAEGQMSPSDESRCRTYVCPRLFTITIHSVHQDGDSCQGRL